VTGDFAGVVLEWEGVVLRPPERNRVAPVERDYRALAGDATVYDDARALLPSLRYRGFRCVVLSTGPFPAEEILAHAAELGLASYIDILASAATGETSEELMEQATTALGLPPAMWVLLCSSRGLERAGIAMGFSVQRIQRGRGTAGAWSSVASVNDVIGERFRPRR
jgi:FMN phosphatase YigB (HAD superfamily)